MPGYNREAASLSPPTMNTDASPFATSCCARNGGVSFGPLLVICGTKKLRLLQLGAAEA